MHRLSLKYCDFPCSREAKARLFPNLQQHVAAMRKTARSYHELLNEQVACVSVPFTWSQPNYPLPMLSWQVSKNGCPCLCFLAHPRSATRHDHYWCRLAIMFRDDRTKVWKVFLSEAKGPLPTDEKRKVTSMLENTAGNPLCQPLWHHCMWLNRRRNNWKIP